MTALYPSTSAAQVFIPVPVRLSTTGAAAPIAPDVAPDIADCRLIITNPAGGTVCNALVDAGLLPAGITFIVAPSCIVVSISTSKYTTAGVYAVTLDNDATANYQTVTTSFQWGGWVDTLIASVEMASTEATVARQLVGNRIDVDNPAAPTELTYYADDNTTPIATRTIANADGSAINPAQVLVLGRATP